MSLFKRTMPQCPRTNVGCVGVTSRGCKMLYAIPELDAERLQKVRDIEKEMGLKLLALNALDVGPANIQDEELDDSQALENKLGVTLVAVN